MNDARENYKAVFGIYPNERKQAHVEPADPDQARKLAAAMESIANELHAVWEQSQFAGVSPLSQDLLRQIQATTALLQCEIAKMG